MSVPVRWLPIAAFVLLAVTPRASAAGVLEARYQAAEVRWRALEPAGAIARADLETARRAWAACRSRAGGRACAAPDRARRQALRAAAEALEARVRAHRVMVYHRYRLTERMIWRLDRCARDDDATPSGVRAFLDRAGPALDEAAGWAESTRPRPGAPAARVRAARDVLAALRRFSASRPSSALRERLVALQAVDRTLLRFFDHRVADQLLDFALRAG